MRGIVPLLKDSDVPLRINAIAPGWTLTGMVPKEAIEAAGGRTQTPDVAARSVAVLMADTARQGELIYSEQGKFIELESALLKVIADLGIDDDPVLQRIYAMAASQQKSGVGTIPGSSS